jgi:hypothetical protein
VGRIQEEALNMAKPKIKLPSKAAIVKELRGIQREMERGEIEEDNYVDVRLQVSSGGDWSVHYGDPSYDTDHRGYWGAGSVGIDADGAELESIAEQLIEEAAESMAQDDTEGVGSGRYSVVVGNIGTVYDGDSRVRARHNYDTYVADSKDGHGRAAGESVTLFEDGEIIAEHHGEHED